MRFISAHFITYGGKCERLHGHNYGVLAEIEGSLNEDHLVFDFTVLNGLPGRFARSSIIVSCYLCTIRICNWLQFRFMGDRVSG